MPRTVSVAITANTSGFTAGMSKISASAKSTASGVQSAFGKGFDSIGKNKRNIDTLATGLGKIGIAAGVGVGFAVKAFADFDKAMSGVAATGSDARANLDALKQAAIDAGAETKYSASEAAGGIEALAKAGVSAKDTLGGGLKGSLDLAAAGNLDVAGSAEAAASAMNQFGLAGADIPHVADLLAQSAGTAQGEVSDMASALNQSGLIANQFGLSIDETAQALALFAKNGLVGSDAGTAFKTMLSSLYAPTGNAAKTLDQLGISAYDASGGIKDIGPLADDLKAKLDGLSEGDRNAALKNIFGSDAIRAGAILLKDGSAGLAQMATEFGKFGSAADVARTKMDNLSGDLEQLKGSFETALIGLGEGGSGPLRELAQSATGVVNAFNDLGSGTKSGILAAGAIGAGALLGVAGLAKLAIGISNTVGALKALGITSSLVKGKLSAIGIAGAAAAAGFIAVQAASAALDSQVEKASGGLDGYTAGLLSLSAGGDLLDENFAKVGNSVALAGEGVHDTSSAFKALAAATNPVAKGFTAVGNALGITSTLQTLNNQFDLLDKSLVQMKPEDAAAAFQKLSKEATAAGFSVEDQAGIFDDYRASLVKQANELKVTTLSAQEYADWMGGKVPAAIKAAQSAGGKPVVKPDAFATAGAAIDQLGADAAGSAKSLDDLAASLFAANDAALASSDAQIGYEQAVDAAKAAVKGMTKAQVDSGKAGDVTTKLGQESQTVLNRLAGQTKAYAQSLVAQGKGAKAAADATADGRKEFIKTATDMGISGKAARQMANDYGLVPKKVKTEVETNAGKSKADLKELQGAIKGLPKKTQAEIIAAFNKGGIAAGKAALDAAAKKRQARIDAKAFGVRAAADGISEAARDRRTTITVNDQGTGAAGKSISEAARDRRANINVSTSGVGEARAAIATIQGKTVNVIIHRTYTGRDNGGSNGATGGLFTTAGFTARGPLQRSNGGPVWGAGTATSDSIPALLSNGEFVIRAAAVKAVGITKLKDLNAQGFASGGPVGLAAGGPVGPDALAILKYMAAVLNPLADVNKARRKIAEARDDKQDADTKKERRKADRELTAATKELKEAQKAAAESMRQTADALADPYRSKSHDIDDWLESMRTGKEDLAKFQDQVGKLRKLGVSEAIIKQITDQGAIVGSELAQQIIDGGSELAKSLNKANTDLQKASQNLAYTATVKPKGHAAGGPVSGPGTGTSDSIAARLSNGEWVVPAHAVGANRSMLEAITYGRSTPQHRFMPGYAYGGPVASTVTKEYRGGDVHQYLTTADPDQWNRKARAAQRDSQTMFGLTVGV